MSRSDATLTSTGDTLQSAASRIIAALGGEDADGQTRVTTLGYEADQAVIEARDAIEAWTRIRSQARQLHRVIQRGLDGVLPAEGFQHPAGWYSAVLRDHGLTTPQDVLTSASYAVGEDIHDGSLRDALTLYLRGLAA